MKTAGGLLAFTLATLIALPNAQARPRLGPGLLLAPLAIVGGIAGAAVGSRKAKASRAYQQRLRRERAATRKARPVKAQPVQARPAVQTPAAQPPAMAAKPNAAAAATVAAAWAGPLFWPHAYDDVFGYALARPGDADVWSRGFGDAVAGLFANAGVHRTALSERGMEPAWDNLCGSETPNAAGATLAHIRDTVKPTAAQQASLVELGEALTRAAERIEAACPAHRPDSATERLHMMIARLTAMRQAVLTVQAPLRNFYEQLDDTQRAALDGATDDGAQKPADANAAADAANNCAQPAGLPQRQLERALQPTPAQRPEFERFYRTAMGLDRFVASTCPDRETPPRTAPERLEAIKDRLAVLRYAATSLSPAYERLERSLSDTQKTRLGALSRDRTAETSR